MNARLLFCSAIIIFITGVAPAVVTEDTTTSEQDPSAYYPSFDWDGIFRAGAKTLTAVDSHWLISTEHAGLSVGTTFTSGGTTYTIEEVIDHLAAADPNHNTNADLALHRVDKALSTFYELYDGSYDTSGSDKTEVLILGTGHSKDIITDNSTGLDSYTWDDSSTRQRRWGTNKLDWEGVVTSGSVTHDAIRADFILDDTTYEGGAADHDSGGGWFVNDGGTWKLAGLNWADWGTHPNPPYETTFAVDLRDYETWVENTIPEPATMALLAIGGAAMLQKRRNV